MFLYLSFCNLIVRDCLHFDIFFGLRIMQKQELWYKKTRDDV